MTTFNWVDSTVVRSLVATSPSTNFLVGKQLIHSLSLSLSLSRPTFSSLRSLLNLYSQPFFSPPLTSNHSRAITCQVDLSLERVSLFQSRSSTYKNVAATQRPAASPARLSPGRPERKLAHPRSRSVVLAPWLSAVALHALARAHVCLNYRLTVNEDLTSNPRYAANRAKRAKRFAVAEAARDPSQRLMARQDLDVDTR